MNRSAHPLARIVRFTWLRFCLCASPFFVLLSPAMGQTSARATCPLADQPNSVKEARAAFDRAPGELAPRLRLADSLVDQGCYNDAVAVLEAGQVLHPHSNELAGKLRDVRSMLTEQTYIQGLAQAEDAAKLRRNQLRCATFTDLDACNEVVKVAPNDPAMLAARADALTQAGRLQEALVSYQRALQLNPTDDSLKVKLAAARSRESANPQVSEPKPVVMTPQPPLTPRVAAASKPGRAVAANVKPSRSPVATPNTAPPAAAAAQVSAYSNDAPEGRSN